MRHMGSLGRFNVAWFGNIWIVLDIDKTLGKNKKRMHGISLGVLCVHLFTHYLWWCIMNCGENKNGMIDMMENFEKMTKSEIHFEIIITCHVKRMLSFLSLHDHWKDKIRTKNGYWLCEFVRRGEDGKASRYFMLRRRISCLDECRTGIYSAPFNSVRVGKRYWPQTKSMEIGV